VPQKQAFNDATGTIMLPLDYWFLTCNHAQLIIKKSNSWPMKAIRKKLATIFIQPIQHNTRQQLSGNCQYA
jgi:hypothetical protein